MFYYIISYLTFHILLIEQEFDVFISKGPSNLLVKSVSTAESNKCKTCMVIKVSPKDVSERLQNWFFAESCC